MSRLSRIPRVASIATVAVLGFGGVAAAATGTNPLDPVLADAPPSTDAPVSTEAPTTLAPTTSVPSTADEPSATTLTPPPVEVVCPEDASNHGEAVSQVAHDDSLTGAAHGAAVSAMAQSDCGKSAEEITEPKIEATVEAPEAVPTEVECPEGAKNHGDAVSSVAKDRSKHGREHGAAVSAMAQSDCGKDSGGTDETDD